MVEIYNSIVTVSRFQRSGNELDLVGDAVQVAVYAQAKPAAQVFTTYGVQLKNPLVILCNLEDVDLFRVSGPTTVDGPPQSGGKGQIVEVLCNGRIYTVAADPIEYQNDDEGDHATILLDRIRHRHA